MKLGLVIPWRETPSRIKPFEIVVDWYKTNLTDIEIFYADRPGNWNIAASRNDGVKKAQEAHCDVIIVNDADTLPEIEPLLKAIEECQKDGMIHNPFSVCKTFTEKESQLFYENTSISLYNLKGTVHQTSVGGVYVCTPEAWWNMGGQDEKFIQWGYEDSAFDIAHQIIHKTAIKKHPGYIYSLGHKEQIHDEGFNKNQAENRDLYLRYFQNHTPESILKLIKQKY